ncbi:phospholipase D-like domain-containing protein [Microvirga roseola]|uniref:phospholipase D-like domain-containing protein n=1 Tax=Microvirga roseola TaxID=2883126 RepID=UPI001E51B1C1|nr:phospholipase D-like domain-containing protein [Microvirga roseola]
MNQSKPSRAAQSVLQPGRNCWRIETAHRASCLIDGEEYFPAVKQVLLRAQHSVLLLAWDFAERARLEPGNPHASEPDRIGDLLQTLVASRKDLQVRVLVWDKAMWLALRRQRIPGMQAQHLNDERLRYILDDRHPTLACHHQKVLVIDDTIAFCGGFDLAANRWDTRAHLRHDRRRHKPSGQPYQPHHDVMMAVNGPAARALGDLARARLYRATGERLEPAAPGQDPWPECLKPDFWDVPVGIARTIPAWQDQVGIREVEQLYIDAIASARQTIYMENQYLASHRVGDALAERLTELDGPEIVIINPQHAPSTIEQMAMDHARTVIVQRLRDADRFGRLRCYAALTEDAEIVVHSKVMVVDDRFLRIGSSNLNNRSMGTDTECDLAIDATPGMEREADIRKAIRHVRNRLVAEHVGASIRDLSKATNEYASVIGAIERLNGRSSRRLVKFPEAQPSHTSTYAHDRLTDPASPPVGELRRRFRLGRKGGGARLAVGGLMSLSVCVLLWWMDARSRRSKSS